jgi:MFS family permease
MFIAPAAGRLTDRIGGKYILMSGLLLFGFGMGWLALIASPSSSWPEFLAPLIVAGIGMGCVFAPLVTTAMRNIQPQMAGAASGVLNTIRQVGLVIGTAAVGALLQNRLVSEMTSQATARSAALPAEVRSRFITEIQNTAKNGIQVGAGQNGGLAKQSGLPGSLVAEVARIGHEVFAFGYVDAMRSTMVLPVVLLTAAALSCLAIQQRKRQAAPAPAVAGAVADGAAANGAAANGAPVGGPAAEDPAAGTRTQPTP